MTRLRSLSGRNSPVGNESIPSSARRTLRWKRRCSTIRVELKGTPLRCALSIALFRDAFHLSPLIRLPAATEAALSESSLDLVEKVRIPEFCIETPPPELLSDETTLV